MFKNGLKHSGLLLLVSVPIGVIVSLLTEAMTGVTVSYLVILAGAIYFGYTYYSKYGPLFLSNDGSALKRLFMYSMAFGTTFGLPYLVLVIQRLEGAGMVVILLISCLAIPLMGMKFIGAFALGRFFNS